MTDRVQTIGVSILVMVGLMWSALSVYQIGTITKHDALFLKNQEQIKVNQEQILRNQNLILAAQDLSLEKMRLLLNEWKK